MAAAAGDELVSVPKTHEFNQSEQQMPAVPFVPFSPMAPSKFQVLFSGKRL